MTATTTTPSVTALGAFLHSYYSDELTRIRTTCVNLDDRTTRVTCIAALCVNLLIVARGHRPAYLHSPEDYEQIMRTRRWFGWREGVAVPYEALRAWFDIYEITSFGGVFFVNRHMAALHADTLATFNDSATTRATVKAIGHLLGYRTPFSHDDIDAANARTANNAPPKCTFLMVRFMLAIVASPFLPSSLETPTELYSYRAMCGADTAAALRLRGACLEDLCAIRRVVTEFGIDARVDLVFKFTYSAWTGALDD